MIGETLFIPTLCSQKADCQMSSGDSKQHQTVLGGKHNTLSCWNFIEDAIMGVAGIKPVTPKMSK